MDDLHNPDLYPPQVDSRHYFFVRDSGLPRDYFKPWRPTPDQCVFWATVIAFVVGVLFLGVLE